MVGGWTADRAGRAHSRSRQGRPHRLGDAGAAKIDRIACPWLIRRFVDPGAVFLFVAPPEVEAVADRFGATPFDVEDVFWSHRGDLCTFDVMVEEFGLDDRASAAAGRASCGPPTRRGSTWRRKAAGLLAASLGLSRMYRRRSRAARRRHDALRRVLSLGARRHRRDAQLAFGQGRGQAMSDVRERERPTYRGRPRRTAFRSPRRCASGRASAALSLRRPRRADRRDAPHPGRGEALDRRAAVPARAQLLHAAARPRGAAARRLYRLAAAQDEGRARRGHAVRPAGLPVDPGAELSSMSLYGNVPLVAGAVLRPQGGGAGDRARRRCCASASAR